MNGMIVHSLWWKQNWSANKVRLLVFLFWNSHNRTPPQTLVSVCGCSAFSKFSVKVFVFLYLFLCDILIKMTACFKVTTLVPIWPRLKENQTADRKALCRNPRPDNRRLLHDVHVRLRDIPTAHVYLGTCRCRAKKKSTTLVRAIYRRLGNSRRHKWAEFVGSLLCSERFFSGYSGFPLSSKTNIWFDLESIWFRVT